MESGYLVIDNNIFSTLLAISRAEQERGLMEQEWPPPVMSFIYPRAQYNKFWMKNTPSPLDIIFAHNGVINQICYGEPHSTAMIGEDKLSDLVVEFPHGTIISSNIKIGHPIGLVKPTPEELKIIIARKCDAFIKI